VTFSGANDHERVLYIEGIASFWELDSGDRVGGAQVPILMRISKEIYTKCKQRDVL